MPTVIISDAMLAKLQLISVPFVDTMESRIERLIDDEVARRGQPSNGNSHFAPANGKVLQLDPIAHENLVHTRLISANVDGQELYRPKWNGLLDHLHIIAQKRLGSFEALKRASGAHVRQGQYEQQGFGFVREANISIQGVDSNLAWDHSLRLARAIEVPIKVSFEWREKEGAAHPGERGTLEWTPAK